ncbi:hypothetical protein VCHA53O466_50020 [Vibrio chagasii]|nr:hypothetical protein VCHA53O466_50020 [Vibrio chagasii]
MECKVKEINQEKYMYKALLFASVLLFITVKLIIKPDPEFNFEPLTRFLENTIIGIMAICGIMSLHLRLKLQRLCDVEIN